ncbi:hypothetical protein [Sphingobium sp. ba1]|uniref:hypothetical protein n=1 Tax=Sphingobium sp. ba1 TaxID=1522072 RepID=UPI0012E01C2C|nr:hypothetical protein [Sphingobium sp. ba1]
MTITSHSNGNNMRADLPRSRAEWFVPHETTITLPDGRELQVDGIPYKGWGTDPGKVYRVTQQDSDGKIVGERSWVIPMEPNEFLPG